MMAGYTQTEIGNWGTFNDPMMRANLAIPAPPAGPETVQPLPTLRPKEDVYNPTSWRDHITGGDWANAGITLALSGITGLFNAFSSNKIYNMYKEQEQYILENAAEQARRLQIKGDIALANLNSKHAITEGTNELAVAGAGAGSISGSFLDKLMANRKYDTREEFAQSLDTLYAVDNAKRDGFIQAYSIAGQAMQQAYKQRGDYLTNFAKGLAMASSALVSDVKQGYKNEAIRYGTEQKYRTDRQLDALKFATPGMDSGLSGATGISGSIPSTGYITPNTTDPFKLGQEAGWGYTSGSTDLNVSDYSLIKVTK